MNEEYGVIIIGGGSAITEALQVKTGKETNLDISGVLYRLN